MPNHVHVLLTPKPQVSRLLQMLKGRQNESFDRVVRNHKEFERIRGYIDANPVKAAVVNARRD